MKAKYFHSLGDGVEFVGDDIEASIPERFEKIVCKYPDRVAVKTGGEVVTYAELNVMANRVAHTIVSRRGSKAETIAILLDNGARLMAAMIAVLKAGKCFVLLDRSFPRARLANILEDSQAHMIISGREHAEVTRHFNGADSELLDFDSAASHGAEGNVHLSIWPNALAALIYTSGSTGEPKGVMCAHKNFLHQRMLFASAYNLSEFDRVLLTTSATHNTMSIVFLALLNGAALLPFDVRGQGVNGLIKWVLEERISIFWVGSPLFRNMCRTLKGEDKFPDVRIVRLASEASYKSDIELFKQHFPPACRLINGLSNTESGLICLYPVDIKRELPCQEVPVGYPVKDKEVFLLDDAGNEVGINKVGEIAVRSRYLSPGYWQRPELTADRFKADPNGGDQRIYFTSDLGIRLPDGCLIHKGRKDFRVKVRGYGVETAEVEKVLNRHPFVAQTVVVARGRDSGDAQLVAYYTCSALAAPTVTELRSFLREHLPDFMIPSAFVRLETIPLTHSGKINRRSLPDPDNERPGLSTPYLPSRNEIERKLVAVWEEVLDVHPIGIRDNFFDLGGHSLLAIRLLAEVEKKFGARLPVATLLQTSTIEHLALILSEQSRSQRSSLIPVQRAGSKPPFFCVHGTNGYIHLARYLGLDQPFYGLAQHFAGRKIRYTKIEDIAAHYLSEIRTVQSEGPYFLGGHSIGGLIAFEMAQQLQRQGQEVALLALLDPGSPKDVSKITSSLYATVCHHRQSLSMLSLKEKLRYIAKRGKQRVRRRTSMVACKIYHFLGVLLPPRLQTFYMDQLVYGVYYPRAKARYVAKPYRGWVVYFKSEVDTRERVVGWQELISGQLEIQKVPGDHLSMLMQPHVSFLGDKLKACLSKAQTVTHAKSADAQHSGGSTGNNQDA